MEPKLDPNRTKIEDEKQDAKRSASRSSWGGLGGVLERSWVTLAELEAILERFGGGCGGQNRCFSLGFSILFDKSIFRMKMVILAGLGAILGLFGENLGAFGPILARRGRPRDSKREPKRPPRGVQKESQMTSIFLSIFGSIWAPFWTPKGGEGPRIWATAVRPGPGTLARLYVYICPAEDENNKLLTI